MVIRIGIKLVNLNLIVRKMKIKNNIKKNSKYNITTSSINVNVRIFSKKKNPLSNLGYSYIIANHFFLISCKWTKCR